MATWHVIEPVNTSKLKLGAVAGVVSSLAFIALWLAVMVIPNKVAIIVPGVVYWAAWIAFQVYVQRNPVVDRPLKRYMLFTIIPMFAIAIRMLVAIAVQ